MMKRLILQYTCYLLLIPWNEAFSPSNTGHRRAGSCLLYVQQGQSSPSPQSPNNNTGIIISGIGTVTKKTRRARDLIQSLIVEDGCYATTAGARAFANVCAVNVVYEDRFEPQPKIGKQAVLDHLLAKRSVKVRIDKISDGDVACGFAWTWVTDEQEGLRGTTFLELNDNGEIVYVFLVRSIPIHDSRCQPQ
jgi:hypothetical protein